MYRHSLSTRESIVTAGTCWIANQVIEVLFRFWMWWSSFLTKTHDTLSLLSYRDQLRRHDFQRLLPQKRPKHLGVVLPQRNHPISFDEGVRKGMVEDIANLASWSIRSQIWTLTIYHRQVIPIDLHCDILSSIKSKIQTSSCEKPPRVTISTLNSSLEREEPIDDKEQYLQIRLLDQSDGRLAVMSLAQRLKALKEQNLIPDDALTPEAITERLNTLYGGAPDLIFIFGPHNQLKGYPPWQLRYAEFKTFSDNPALRCLHFLQGLQQFAKVEMREGK